MNPVILLVEDDTDINSMVSDLLKLHGYEVQSAFSGSEALLQFERTPCSLVLLDWMLPGIGGKDVLSEIRKYSKVPVIGLSARDDTGSKVDFLRAGADDYMTKPFENEELLARVEAQLRRASIETKEAPDGTFAHKDIVLDPGTMEVLVSGKPISLTRREYDLLHLLMGNPRKIFTKSNIFSSLWNEQFQGEENAVNVHISNLRQKLQKYGSHGPYIQTVWGIGFKMAD